MSNYPLEWGWHAPPDPPDASDNTPLWPTLLGVGDNDAILAANTPPSAISTGAPRDKTILASTSALTSEGALPSLDTISGSVAAIAKRAAAFDMRRKDEIQSFYPRLTSSPLADGSSGPMIGNTTTMTPESASAASI